MYDEIAALSPTYVDIMFNNNQLQSLREVTGDYSARSPGIVSYIPSLLYGDQSKVRRNRGLGLGGVTGLGHRS